MYASNLPVVNLDVTGPLTQQFIDAFLAAELKLPQRFWSRIRPEFLRENSGFASDIVIIFPEGGIESDEYPGFYYVPGFTRYVVNKQGEVFSTQLKTMMLSYVASATGYRMYGMTRDDGKRTIIGMHRVLALAFKPFGVNVGRLDVNHIDGDKLNNDLDNLEWVTRSRNNIHAMETGLKTDNKPVVLKSIFTGEEMEFYGYSDCKRKTGISEDAIGWRAKSEGQRVYHPGILVKNKDCDKPWLSLTKEEISNLPFGLARVVELESPEGVKTYQQLAEVAKVLGLNRATLQWRLERWGTHQHGRFKVRQVSLEDSCKSLFSGNALE